MTLSNAFRKRCANMIANSETGVAILWDDELKGTDGQFQYEEKRIILNAKNILSTANHYSERSGIVLTPEVYTLLVIAHELGHASDIELPYRNVEKRMVTLDMQKAVWEGQEKEFKMSFKELARLTIEGEEMAWSLAEQFFPSDVNRELVEMVSFYCLQSYTQTIRFEYCLYLNSLKLIPLLNKVSFFPPKMSFTIEFSIKQPFSVNEEEQCISIPLAKSYHYSRKRYYPLKNTPYIFFECLLDYLKWTDRKRWSAIEELENKAFYLFEKKEELSNILAPFEAYNIQKEEWLLKAFTLIKPHIREFSDEFEAYCNHMLNRDKREYKMTRQFYISHCKKEHKQLCK